VRHLGVTPAADGRAPAGLPFRPDAVLLDMDGTLVDSDAAVERAWTTWVVEHGVDGDAVRPEGFLIAAARLGAAPARCLVVEDAEPGVTAGRAAGMTVAGLRGIEADVAVADLGELADLLVRCGR
jgi:beta-phosphoglucomutase-like phosphatase (HAD superfamily)